VVVVPDTGTWIEAKRDCVLILDGRDVIDPGATSAGAVIWKPRIMMSVVGVARYHEYGLLTVQVAVEPLRVASGAAVSRITFLAVEGPSVTSADAMQEMLAVAAMLASTVIEKFTTMLPVVAWADRDWAAAATNIDTSTVSNVFLCTKTSTSEFLFQLTTQAYSLPVIKRCK